MSMADHGRFSLLGPSRSSSPPLEHCQQTEQREKRKRDSHSFRLGKAVIGQRQRLTFVHRTLRDMGLCWPGPRVCSTYKEIKDGCLRQPSTAREVFRGSKVVRWYNVWP